MDLGTLARAYDRSAATYDERFRALQRPKYRAAAQLLERAGFPSGDDGWLLDAGGGTGLFIEWLRDESEPSPELRARLLQLVERGRFLLLDLSVPMLREARGRARGRVAADLAHPPLRAKSCALIVSFTALLENVAASLSALAWLLEPEGRLCATFLARESPSAEVFERASGLFHTSPPLPAGQDLVHLVGHRIAPVRDE